jgi:uncharacterized membrane protein
VTEAGGLVLPSRDDPVAAGATGLLGGPAGRHVRVGSSWWTPVRVVLLLAVIALSLAWGEKAACRSPSFWHGEQQYVFACYSDVSALYYAEGLNTGQVPYRDHPVEYPVLIGGMMQAASSLAHLWPAGDGGADRAKAFFDVTALMLAACGLIVVVTTARLAGRRPYDAALVALAPTLILHAYTNWDLLAVALTGLGMLAWARRRPAWSGVWLGLGVAAKLYPLLIVGALFLLCWRARRWREFGRMLAAAGAAWLVVDLPVWALWPASFGRFWTGNRSRDADWDSWWLGLQHLGFHPSVSTLNILVGLTFAACLVGVAALVWRAPERPRVAQIGFLVVAAFLLTNKVYSPQYVLWLLPLAALARPRWRAFLAWQATEVLLLLMRFNLFIHNDVPAKGVGFSWFEASVLLRDAALLVLMALVVRDVLRPDHDPVRRDDRAADPAGGVLGSAPPAYRRILQVS